MYDLAGSKKSFRLYQTQGPVLTLANTEGKESFGRKPQESDLGLAEKICFVADSDGIIAWQGLKQKIPKEIRKRIRGETKLSPGTILPGFVESHTHLVFAGHRQNEFEMRNAGATYQEIAEKGGGIVSTVAATRKASPSQLLQLAQYRAEKYISQGVTTLEAKSGYGLNWAEESKILAVVQSLAKKLPIEVIATYLGPHAKSPERASLDEYFDDIIQKQLPQLTKAKIRRADIFIEKGYFTRDQGRKYLEILKTLGIGATVHADQLSDSGACALGAQMGALSVDHCVNISDVDIRFLAQSSTTAVLLPTADFYLKISYPPARKMIAEGVRVAVATDFNPGSSPTQDLSFVGVLSRLEMKMSLPEVIFAYTLNAAHALGVHTHTGSLDINKRLNFSTFDCDWSELFYQVGAHPVREVWTRGKRIWSAGKNVPKSPLKKT